MMQNQRQNVREVIKGKDSIKSGIQKVRELLKSGRIKINRRCINTIHEFETYSYDDDKEQRDIKENPIKENDHALDAIRYVVMMKATNNNEPTGRWNEQDFNTY